MKSALIFLVSLYASVVVSEPSQPPFTVLSSVDYTTQKQVAVPAPLNEEDDEWEEINLLSDDETPELSVEPIENTPIDHYPPEYPVKNRAGHVSEEQQSTDADQFKIKESLAGVDKEELELEADLQNAISEFSLEEEESQSEEVESETEEVESESEKEFQHLKKCNKCFNDNSARCITLCEQICENENVCVFECSHSCLEESCVDECDAELELFAVESNLKASASDATAITLNLLLIVALVLF